MSETGQIAERGLVLLGCGKMGTALLEGWLADGLPAASVWVIDPKPHDGLIALEAQGLHLNAPLPEAPAVCLLAVKPQMMGEALPAVRTYGGGDTLVISIAAGTPISAFEAIFGPGTPIVRAMPNTPAAIGRGITAYVGNGAAGAADLDLAGTLLSAVGEAVEIGAEAQIDAVTGVSGSGPAYVFHLIECLAAAGEAEGLDPALSMRLAKATVAGAGALALQAAEDPAQLRVNVTSPGGTTAAALAHLMDPETGFPRLVQKAVSAAADRGRELSR